MKSLIFFFGMFLFASCLNGSKKPATSTTVVDNIDTIKYQNGDTLYPFKNFDFSGRDWEAVIEIDKDDMMDLSVRVPKKNRLSTTEIEVLNKLKDWGFIYQQSDMATVLNTLKLLCKGKTVVEYGIVLDVNSVGLQSSTYGWINSFDSSKIFETIRFFK
jgi:hypothetical protein